ncbi:hypothetical protein [Ornithinimicrobium panacihumi]|uniref:hypothetical protein n=1 Tax=Ornithinimicrobium panacihumi TaxID=2008449 RepID=UPI003F8CD914
MRRGILVFVGPERRVLLAVVSAMALSSCAAGQPSPKSPDITDVSERISYQGYADDAWERVVAIFPESTRPVVDTVDTISPDDWAKVQSTCLQEQGFPVKAMLDGGLFFGDVHPDQGQALHVAMYVCEVRFPIDAKYLTPLDDEEIERIFQYQTGPLTECLEARGHRVPEPPSFERFSAELLNGSLQWSAYGDVRVPHQEWLELNEACPQVPPYGP